MGSGGGPDAARTTGAFWRELGDAAYDYHMGKLDAAAYRSLRRELAGMPGDDGLPGAP
ncbi:MAG: hypothetical protein IRY95_10810 [Clostridia bacterium]|nr:hypothetical protein [Clostridia bacterium]